MKHSKRYSEALQSSDPKTTVAFSDAISKLKEHQTKFDQSVEIHIRLGIDPRKSDQAVRTSVTLPHGTGKTVTIVVFADDENEKAAQDAGADIVGGQSIIDDIAKTSKTDFDIAIATPSMMKALAPIAKILGQRGKMPNPKSGTVTQDVSKTVAEMKKGKVTFKNDVTGNIHQVIGKISFTPEQLEENYNTLMEAVRSVKPENMKGEYIKTVFVTTTMGPSHKLA